MSGVEVVGLVLGAVPLLISGLEHYAEGVKTIETIKNASQHFAKYKRALGTERAIFENNLRYLLENDLNGTLIDKMFDSVSRAGWTDPEVEKCLRRRLGRSYDAFYDTAKAVDLATGKMMKYLQLTEDGKGPFDSKDKSSVRRGCSKLLFGMRIKKYKELLDEIVLENQRLNQLSQRSRDLDSIRESKITAPDFEIGREHARSLFVALQHQPESSCNLGHSISLFMNPAGAADTKNVNKLNPRRLRAVFTHLSTGMGHLTPPWTMEETEVEPIPDDSDSEGDTSVKPSRVRFAVLNPADEMHRYQQKLSEIRDLCASFQSTQSPPASRNTCIGYLFDHQINYRHGLFRPDVPMVDTKFSAIALTHILDHPRKHRLRPMDKRILALNLALGMLRLHNTPWLKPQWGRHEVFVFQHMGSLVVSHPFILQEICTTFARQSLSPTKYFRSCRLIVEPTLFALGVLLIELALEAPFESLVRPEDCNPDGTKHKLTDFYAASRLVDDVYRVSEFRYGTVVKRCIHCEFDHPPHSSSLLDSEFRRKVYRGVVESLQQEVDDVKSI